MNIPYGNHYIDKKDAKAVIKSLNNKFITQGPLIYKFEQKICKIVKSKYAVAVSSCSAGLHLAVKSLERSAIKKRIITSPITFVSTCNAILMNDYKPEFIDINKYNLNIDPKKLEDYLKKNKQVKAIMPVHLAGNSIDSEKIFKICKSKKISIIEDAAHSFGAKYKNGSMVGSCAYSDMTVFSFHPVKTLTTGEGGVITTNSLKLYKKLLLLRNHGIEKNHNNWINTKNGFSKSKVNQWYYEAQELGFNYRITDFQCALGLSQLKKLKKVIQKRKFIAKNYDSSFKNTSNLYLPQFLRRDNSSNHLYILNLNFNNLKIKKNKFIEILHRKGIGSQVHYIPVPMHPIYKKLGYNMKKLPVAKKYYESALSIPIFFNLSFKNQKKIIKNIKIILKRYSKA